jgi:hypothetical protein
MRVSPFNTPVVVDGVEDVDRVVVDLVELDVVEMVVVIAVVPPESAQLTFSFDYFDYNK